MAAHPGSQAAQGGPIPQAQPRPSMRRKSSAQTLFSSFKSSSSGLPTTAPPTQLSMQIPNAGMPNGFGGGGGQREAGTPVERSHGTREWDSQSMKSDSTNAAGSISTAPGNPPLVPGISLESLRDMTMKRMITLTYLRNIHEGRSHWFNTVMVTRSDLDREFNNAKMKKRTLSFAILGMSLSGVFDNTNSSDLLKSLVNILNENENSKETDLKPKMQRLFKSNTKARRGTNAMNDYAVTIPEAGETSYLVAPHIPFQLDYHQTLLSLFDILSEVYNRMSKILGPSPFPHANQYMMGPLGVLTPTPGVSYLFHSQPQPGASSNHAPSHHASASIHHSSHQSHHQSQMYPLQMGLGTSSGGTNTSSSSNGNNYSIPAGLENPNRSQDGADSGSLWGIANANGHGGGVWHVGGGGAQGGGPGGLMSPPPSWNPALGDMMLKVDSKLKKIIGVLLKELDQLARNSIKDELASLDPLLRNQTISEAREHYQFDPSY